MFRDARQSLLLERLASFEALMTAWKKVRANKGAPGIDQVTLQEFEKGLQTNLEALSRSLREGTYYPMPVRKVPIKEASGKERPLGILVIEDHIAQRAALDLLEPLFEEEFLDCSFGYRPGRSIEQAIGRVLELRAQGNPWVVDADIQDFFGGLDHRLLMDLLAQRIKDERVLRLIRLWLEMGSLPVTGRAPRGGMWEQCRRQGVVQGGALSPLLSNVYFHPFDRAMVRQGYHLVRYCDDFLILCPSEARARQALEAARRMLSDLRLSLHPEKTRILRFENGFRFLGHLFAATGSHPHPQHASPGQSDCGPSRKGGGQGSGGKEGGLGGGTGNHGRSSPGGRAGDEAAVIYLTEQGAVLTKADGRIVVRKDKKILLDIPAFKVGQVVVFGNAHLTTPAVNFCLQEGIDVCFLSRWGTYRGRLQSGLHKDASLRQRQYSLSQDPQFCLRVARAIVRGKIRNAVAFCRRQRRKGKEAGGNLRSMEEILSQVERAQSLDSLRGYEGTAAALYYGLFRGLLKEDWGFRGRLYHPSPDPLNALLSLGYTLLYNHAYAIINVVGLDPYQGFFHQLRHGHAALASDLMEEFRSILVDSVVLWTANKGMVRPRDFQREGEELRLTDEGLKRFLSAYDQRLRREVVYPSSGERTSYLRCMELQARQLARLLRGQAQGYRPFETGGAGN